MVFVYLLYFLRIENSRREVKRVSNPYAYIVEHAQSVGRRSNQEDAILCSDESVYLKKGILAVLSDGMGGMSEGERFSAIATQCMIRYFEETEPLPDMCDELRACFNAAQKEALKVVKGGIEGGATVVAIMIRNGRCAYLSAGDSCICLLRKGGLIYLNREQELGVTLDESAAFGYLDEEFARSNTRRGSLTFHLGSESGVPCDVCSVPFMVMPGDRIALMSDGVFGTLNDDELVYAIGKGSCEQAVQNVISDVMAKGKPRQDNCSILLLSFEKISSMIR